MARTKRNAMNIAEARQKIQTTQLVKRLTDHALGSVDMSSTQVTAALGLLKKSIPDLGAVTLASDPANPLVTEIRVKIVDPRS